MKMNLKPLLTECPNCNAIWCLEEYEWQQCDACGYPDNDDYAIRYLEEYEWQQCDACRYPDNEDDDDEPDIDTDPTYDDSKEESIMKHGICADRNNFY